VRTTGARGRRARGGVPRLRKARGPARTAPGLCESHGGPGGATACVDAPGPANCAENRRDGIRACAAPKNIPKNTARGRALAARGPRTADHPRRRRTGRGAKAELGLPPDRLGPSRAQPRPAPARPAPSAPGVFDLHPPFPRRLPPMPPQPRPHPCPPLTRRTACVPFAPSCSLVRLLSCSTGLLPSSSVYIVPRQSPPFRARLTNQPAEAPVSFKSPTFSRAVCIPLYTQEACRH
jgi:hypothetical protein